MFEVYTYFGRVLKTFPIKDNETHHNAQKEARQFLLSNERDGLTCWLRYKR